MKHFGTALLLLVLLACGPAPAPEADKAPEAPPPPRNESHRFPKEGLVSTSIAAEHALGKDFLPAGNVAEYNRDGKTYTLFLVTTASDEKAGFLAYDVKGRTRSSACCTTSRDASPTRFSSRTLAASSAR